jgi:dipeptidyl-peptidase-4
LKDAPTLAVFRLNRLQNQLDVGLADASSGKVTPFFQDFDPAWVSVREQPLWTHDGRTLLILSERGNWRQLYAVARTDPQPRLITPQPFDVIELVGTDAGDEWVYYLASPEHPAQRHLYRSRLDGSRAPERITPAGLTGTHAYVLAPDGRHAFHTHSTFGRPPATQLVRLPGHEVVRSLEDNQALAAKVAPFARPTEFFTVGGGEGVSLDGWMIRPRDFDPQRRYPVIVFIYGEPANVTVTDAWNGSRVLFHWALADAGYVVLSLDNRGTPAPKGREWRKVIYGEVNVRVAQEQATALQNLLRQRPYLDPTRVGVWGHSGGGSNTLNLLFRAPETYHVGIAIAPVTDQLLYDTIYQERYMGLPAQNPQGYRAGSPIHFAAGLRGKLLLIHGAADDNVHFQNSERLINRLVELQKPFDLMVYPNGSHAVSEGKGYSLHRYQLMARHFLTHLPAGGRP